MNDDHESGISKFIESKLMPVAVKLGNVKALIAIRDGITLAMPLILVGSLFLVIGSFPVPGWPEWLAATGIHGVSIADVFNKIVNGSFGLIGLVGAVGIAYQFARQYNTDGLSSGVIAMSAFFIITPNLLSGDKVPAAGMPYLYLGSRGLFIAILLGLLTGYVFQLFINKNIQIKMPDTVPPAVSRSFSALIPGAVILTTVGLVYAILMWTGNGNIHDLLLHIFSKPFGLLGDTMGGTLLSTFLVSLFWFVGIHGANLVNSIISPIWLMNTDANRALFQKGNLDLAHGAHIITQPFIDNFVYMGGGGATLGLVVAIAILVWRKKASEQNKVLFSLTLTPGLFNINEPAMFGIPIVLNISLLIPFILAPMINVTATYLSMKLGIVPLTTGAMASWTMPPIISGFIVTNSWQGSALQAVNLILDILVYLPFILSVNRQEKMQESGMDINEGKSDIK